MYFRKPGEAGPAAPQRPNRAIHVENSSRVSLTLSLRFSLLFNWSRQVSQVVSLANDVVRAETELPRIVDRTLSRRLFEMRFHERRFRVQRTASTGRDGMPGRGANGRDGRSAMRFGSRGAQAGVPFPLRQTFTAWIERRASVLHTLSNVKTLASVPARAAAADGASRGSGREERLFSEVRSHVSAPTRTGFARLELVGRHFRAVEVRAEVAAAPNRPERHSSRADSFAEPRGDSARRPAAPAPVAPRRAQAPTALAFRKPPERPAPVQRAAPPPVPPPPPKAPAVDMARLDAELWKRFEKRIRIEQERRGR
ncbi:hypothetical protein [Albidovulum aquaemixtae]|uniref:hypothetical protein n=1 Tax=Albidovulum aquaemixtae TaxID=1542388 RepID=UPI0011B21C9F|nr:hypothetical protein [Defluviimonas aquaemixtae]